MEECVKASFMMRGASVTTPLPTYSPGRLSRDSLVYLRGRSDRERYLKLRAYTSILFRDRHVMPMVTGATPLTRARATHDVLHRVLANVVATGTVATSWLLLRHAHFAGRSLSSLVDALGLPTAARADLRRSGRIAPVPLLNFVRDVVRAESDLLQFDYLGMYLWCLDLLVDVRARACAALGPAVKAEIVGSRDVTLFLLAARLDRDPGLVGRRGVLLGHHLCHAHVHVEPGRETAATSPSSYRRKRVSYPPLA
ncbi:hypothetical protein AMAG_18643 [Allomyces macrogynus ATCC 38327]|uniref:Uncharacterized protein n=1 Tax=Allomyces macrogynus (strain ATCC 38327) TaxID=578462 RepID=A0A0L0SGG5_ALLM3|nr:hypothetical protein AMAG_18643 [Allomyces macrogynus ATCC 38327]|eukprot:KNE61534.1 hypothetical protein AMAG_18643 [Allomyces macrogynus ATCC 38327]